MTAVDDLRILAEMAEEIERYGFVGLPLALERGIVTKRGLRVYRVMVTLVDKLRESQSEVAKLTRLVDGLRSDMDRLTSLLPELNAERNV